MQEYLNLISKFNSAIPTVKVDGDFGPSTEAAVIAFNNYYGITTEPKRVTAITWKAITDLYTDIYIGGFVREAQYPGYKIGQEEI